MEVDFIAQMRDRSRLVVQVCESLAESKTRKREVAALREAMIELNLKSGTIVTRSDEEEIEVGGGNIAVIPAWRFLLNLDSHVSFSS
jgi:hypothetical protein